MDEEKNWYTKFLITYICMLSETIILFDEITELLVHNFFLDFTTSLHISLHY